MYIRHFFAAFIVMIITTGCTKDFNPDLNKTEPLFVIQGRISNLRGPYYVRITKSTNLLGMGKQYSYNPSTQAEAVTGAQVIISDDRGISDTLIPANVTAAARYIYIYRYGAIDSVKGQSEDFFPAERGYYQTTKITGQPGHTYHLRVTIGDSVFESSAYMPNVPTLDSVSIQESVVYPFGNKGFLPFAYFSEPQNEKNYYLLQFNDLIDYPYDIAYAHYHSEHTFPFYVMDDKILPPYVNGLAVQVYTSAHYTFNDFWPYFIDPREPLQVRLSSLTKETYNYFDVLRKQLEDDGNVYKPAPAGATGNISNGALGIFYATHISYKLNIPK